MNFCRISAHPCRRQMGISRESGVIVISFTDRPTPAETSLFCFFLYAWHLSLKFCMVLGDYTPHVLAGHSIRLLLAAHRIGLAFIYGLDCSKMQTVMPNT
ncbi:hypothetical protein PVAP13_9KG032240 [Panicum virgatum]|uniref:Uncharacterized protein n=1 Tax=Panicum virgatum TaxID=38727 RepID=A0A8T0NBL2_PANVG|nr:hypothetical protein PVAP13_9KG032240 [Panicum virgatum]